MMATLYDVSVPAISQHLKRIYADNALEREATVNPYLTVQTEGNREVQRKVEHYCLQAIISTASGHPKCQCKAQAISGVVNSKCDWRSTR